VQVEVSAREERGGDIANVWSLRFKIASAGVAVTFVAYEPQRRTLPDWMDLASGEVAMTLPTGNCKSWISSRDGSYEFVADPYEYGESMDLHVRVPRRAVSGPLQCALADAVRRGLPFAVARPPAVLFVDAAPRSKTVDAAKQGLKFVDVRP
jgi:hypothetical protein